MAKPAAHPVPQGHLGQSPAQSQYNCQLTPRLSSQLIAAPSKPHPLLTSGPTCPGHGAAGRLLRHVPVQSTSVPASPAGASAAGCRLPSAAGTAAPPGKPLGQPGKTPCSSHTGTCWGPACKGGVSPRDKAHPSQTLPKSDAPHATDLLIQPPWRLSSSPSPSSLISVPHWAPMHGEKHLQGMLWYHSSTPQTGPLLGAVSQGQGCRSASHCCPSAPLCSPEPCTSLRTPGTSTCGGQRGVRGAVAGKGGSTQGAAEAGGTWRGSLRH